MDRKIKRLKLKGTEAWIDGEKYSINETNNTKWVQCDMTMTFTLPVDHYDIECEEKKTPQPDAEGFCDYDCPFAGSREDYVDPWNNTHYTRCSKKGGALYAWANHYCPFFVEELLEQTSKYPANDA